MSTTLQSTMRDILERCDVAAFRTLNAQLFPQYPQPETAEAALVAIHRARTEAESMDFKFRAYSHGWLTERGLPSGLPDHLRPKAQRLYPVFTDCVGIALGSQSKLVKPALQLVRKPMEDAVAEMAADGVDLNHPEMVPVIKAQMQDRKEREMNALFGRISGAGIP